jgi:hypothetical protein
MPIRARLQQWIRSLRSDIRGATGGHDYRIVARRVRDLPVVVFGVREVRVTADEELSVSRRLRQRPSRLLNAFRELVYSARRIHLNDDSGTDPTPSRFRVGATVDGEFVERKERQERATEFEHDEVIAVEDDRPSEFTVEVSLPDQILHTQGDRVRQRDGITHVPLIPRGPVA